MNERPVKTSKHRHLAFKKQNPRKEIKYCQDSFGNTININKTHTGYTALNEVLCFRFLAKQYNFTKCTFLMNH